MKRPTVVWPDDRLRQPSVAISTITNSVRELYRDLCDSMRAEDGLGMAAIQIGDPRRMFIVNPTLVGKAHAPPFVFINPEIISVSKETEETEEGCLSFPGVVVKVDRPVRARFRALNLYRKQFELEGEGLLARCMLHEYDHLIGRLMTDYGNK